MRPVDRDIISISLTVVIVVLLILHTFYPGPVVDATTLGLVSLLILTWLLPYAKSISLHGYKLDLEDTDEPREKVMAAGGPGPPPGSAKLPESDVTWRSLLRTDVNVALAGLRIDIERHLRELAEKRTISIDGRVANLTELVRELRNAGHLSPAEADAISAVVQVCNRAVHAQRVAPEAALEIAQLGEYVLAFLQRKLAKYRGDAA